MRSVTQALGRRRDAVPPQGVLARQEERLAYVFLSPWLLGLVLFTIGPIIAYRHPRAVTVAS